MRSIKPIETNYLGYRFRSRLEARWAVFFDALGIEWEFEAEGFELPNGERYLPDFRILSPSWPGVLYAEVKPPGGDFTKAGDFAYHAEERVLLLEGMPRLGYFLCAGWKPGSISDEYICSDPVVFTGDRAQPFDFDETNPFCSSAVVESAVRAARAARFEFGEGRRSLCARKAGGLTFYH